MEQKLHQQAPCHLNSQRESHIHSIEPISQELPPYAKEEANGLLDPTQSSNDEDFETVRATNRMPTHTEFFLPKLSTTSVLQTGATVLGSVMKADSPYKKEELDQSFTTVTGLNSQTNPFNIFVSIKSSASTTSPTTLASCIFRGAIRSANEFIWQFTGISLNEDGSFNIHGPKMQTMELATPNTMTSITSWTGVTAINAGDIHQHKPIVQINGDNNNDSAHKLRQAPQNLTQEFDADNETIATPTDPPGSDSMFHNVCSSSPHPPQPVTWRPSGRPW